MSVDRNEWGSCSRPRRPWASSWWRARGSEARTAGSAPTRAARARTPRGRRGRRADRPVPVLLAKVETRDVPIWLEGLGTVAAFQTVTVRAQVDGRLDSRSIFTRGPGGQEGRPARADRSAPVRRSSSTTAEARARARPGAAARARSATSSATRRCARRSSSRSSRSTTSAAHGRAARGRGAGATRPRSRRAKLQLDYARITSPIDGVTGVRLVDPGNLVHADRRDRHRRHHAARSRSRSSSRCRRTTCRASRRRWPRATLAGRGAAAATATTSSATGTLAVIDNQINQATATMRLKAIFANPDQRAVAEPVRQGARCCVATRKDAIVVPGRRRSSAARRARSCTSSAPTTRRSMRPVDGRRHRGRPRRSSRRASTPGEQVVDRGAEPAAAGREGRSRERGEGARPRRVGRRPRRGGAPPARRAAQP